MKIPKKLKYGYKTLTVDLTYSSEIQGHHACYNSWTDKIKIASDPDKAKSHFTNDLIHEIVEAISARRELSLEHWKIMAISEDITDILLLNKLMEPLEP